MVLLSHVDSTIKPKVKITDIGLVTISVGDIDLSFMRSQFDDLVFEIEASLAEEEILKQRLEKNNENS